MIAEEAENDRAPLPGERQVLVLSSEVPARAVRSRQEIEDVVRMVTANQPKQVARHRSDRSRNRTMDRPDP